MGSASFRPALPIELPPPLIRPPPSIGQTPSLEWASPLPEFSVAAAKDNLFHLDSWTSTTFRAAAADGIRLLQATTEEVDRDGGDEDNEEVVCPATAVG